MIKPTNREVENVEHMKNLTEKMERILEGSTVSEIMIAISTVIKTGNLNNKYRRATVLMENQVATSQEEQLTRDTHCALQNLLVSAQQLEKLEII